MIYPSHTICILQMPELWMRNVRGKMDPMQNDIQPLFALLLHVLFGWPKELLPLILLYLPPDIEFSALALYCVSRLQNQIKIAYKGHSSSTPEYFGTYGPLLANCPQKWQICVDDAKCIADFSIGVVRGESCSSNVTTTDFTWSCSHTLSWSSMHAVSPVWEILKHERPTPYPARIKGCEKCTLAIQCGTIFTVERKLRKGVNEIVIVRGNCNLEKCQIHIRPMYQQMRPYVGFGFMFDSVGALRTASFSWKTLVW
jgi:hypothetical protein